MARRSTPWFRAGRGEWFTTINGRQVPLGVRDPADEAAALAALEVLLAALKTKAKDPPPVWADRVGQFLAAKAAQVKPRPVKPVTVAGYRKYLTIFLALHGTESDPTADGVEQAIVRHRPGWSDNSRRNYLAAVELFVRWCGRPLALSKPARESAGAAVVVSEPTYHMAVGAARGDLRPLLVFLWNTGARPSEACGLTAELVDWSAGTATLKEHKTRGKGKTRTIYLSAAALDVLKAQRSRHPAEGDLLFPNRAGRKWTAPNLAKAMWRLSARIGRRCVVYGFRHSYATRALEKGLPDVQVAALLGHGTTRMLHAHYSHLTANARLLREAAEKVA